MNGDDMGQLLLWLIVAALVLHCANLVLDIVLTWQRERLERARERNQQLRDQARIERRRPKR